jgi:adenylate kinase
MLVYIGGVHGVGKTTIINYAVEIAKKENFKLEKTIGTDILMKLAGVKTIEELKKLPEEIRKKYRPEMNKRIYAKDREDFETIRLCDGHFVFWEAESENYGIRETQPWDKQQLIGIILIIADPEDILKRRLDDNIRSRYYHTKIDDIKMEQNLELEVAYSQAKELEKPIEIFKNDNGKAEKIANDILQIVKLWKNSTLTYPQWT